MSNFVVGRNVKVEIASTYGTALPVTAISKADPAVATSNGHALAAKAAGYLTGLTGMVELDGQACRVKSPATNTFQLEGIDTTSSTDFSGTVTFVPVTAWTTLAASTSYSIPNASADKQDVTTLNDVIKKEENGLLAAQAVSIDVRAQKVLDAAMRAVEKAALANNPMLVRITLDNGSQRIFRGTPSLPGESVGLGAVGTGQLEFAVTGRVLFLD